MPVSSEAVQRSIFLARCGSSSLWVSTSAGSFIWFDAFGVMKFGKSCGSRRETNHRPGNHQRLVGADDPDLDRTFVGRDQEVAGCVSIFVQGDPEESQSLADSAADLGCVLTD